MATAISFEGVEKSFIDKGRRVDALRGVDLTIERGQVFGIVGFSGAGKSTLLRTVNALERPTGGRVIVNGQEISSLKGGDLFAARRRIGMIFQQFNLLSSRTVYQNIAYPLATAGVPKAQIVDRVEEVLSFVGLSDKAFAYPSQLSGGQKQRVGIARALATNPDILISDEATSALDPQTTGEVLELLKRVNNEYGVTILLVTHEIDVVREIADRVAVMEDGVVVEEGPVQQLFSAPRTETARRFVASVLRHVPSPETLEWLRDHHPGRIAQVSMSDQEMPNPVLTRVARNHGIDINFLFGGIDELKGRLYGSFTVEFDGPDASVDAAIAELRRFGTVIETPAQHSETKETVDA